MTAYPDDIHRVLICGSRTWPEGDPLIGLILDGIDENHRVGGTHPVVIEGGARGADRCAAVWTASFGSEYPYPHQQFVADWERHGKRAGYLRNVRMLNEGQPDLVLAFVDKPLAESRGTAMMVNLATKAGVPTYVIQYVEATS